LYYVAVFFDVMFLYLAGFKQTLWHHALSWCSWHFWRILENSFLFWTTVYCIKIYTIYIYIYIFVKFGVHVTVHRDKFLTIKPTRCTDFSDLFWNETLHVLDSSSVHHQELFTVHTAMVYVTQVCWQLVSRSICSCSQAVSRPVWHIPLLCVQWITPG